MRHRHLALALLATLLTACSPSADGAAEDSAAGSPAAASGDAATTPASPPPAAAGTTASVDPCSLITAEEVRAIVGSTALDPVSARTHLGQECVFQEDLDGSTVAAASVELNRGPQAMQLFRDMNGSQAEPIADLGDEAYWDGMRQVMVRKGDELLSAYSVMGTRAQLRERAERLARTAASRWP